MIGQINPDVPSSAQVPDVYLYISTTPNSVTTEQPKNLFLVATGILTGSAITNAPYSLTAGTSVANSIAQYSDVTRVNTAFGRRSPIANRFRSAIQEVPLGINIFLAAIQEPTNSGFAGFATKLLMFSGTAQGSGEIRVRTCGYDVYIPVANGDLASTVGVDGKVALDAGMLDAPVVTAGLIGGTPKITITGNATGSNLVIVADGVSKTIAITAADTPTASATAIATALTSDTTYPVSGTSLAGVVTLTYRAGFPPGTLTVTGADATQTFALSYVGAATSGKTVPLTYVVRGEDGNDLPVMVTIPPELTGIAVSCGYLTATTNAAGTSGSASLFTLKCDTTVYTASIPVGSTPTQSAALIVTVINTTTGPLSASSVAGVVTLFYRSGWYVKLLQVSSTEDGGGQVYTLADRHDSAGAITTVATTPGSAAFTGLSGAGVPNLTAMLDNKSKVVFCTEWACDYLDSTSTSAIYAHVEQYGNGYYQQNQRVTWVSTYPLETAALVATSASPQFGNSWRYGVGVYQGAACQGGAYATQTAARLCATDLPFNFDGQQLQVGTFAPMLPGRAETDLSPPSQDVALGSYHLTPYVGINGVVTIVRYKTAWLATNTEWGDASFGRIFDLIRFQLRTFLNSRFRQKVQFFGGGVIRVPNGFRAQDVKNAIQEYLDAVDGKLIDGAKRLRQYIVVEPIPGNLGTLRIYLTAAVPRELHIITGVIGSI